MYSSILLYTVVWCLSCLIVLYGYSKYNGYVNTDEIIENDSLYKKKLTIFSSIIISFLFSFYNFYATTSSNVVGGDRQNYYYNFVGYRETPSIGLGLIMKIINQLGGTIETVYYVTTFICVFITLIAYRLSKKANPFSFYLLCITQYFLTTLIALKQCYTSAFAILFFVLIIDYNSIKTRVLALLCATIACLFHPTGYILFLLFFVICLKKNIKNIAIYFFILLFIGLFFERIMIIGATLLSPLVPSLANKIYEYFAESNDVGDDGIAMVFLKGIPYYFIFALALIKRKYVKDLIDHYDEYLIVVSTGAFLYLVSLYSGWFSRFIYLFSFVSFILFSQILKTVHLKGNRIIYSCFVQILLIAITYRYLYLVYALSGGF